MFLLLSGKSFLCGGRTTLSDVSVSDGKKGVDCNARPEALSNYFCELVKDFDEINKETATNEGKSTKS